MKVEEDKAQNKDGRSLKREHGQYSKDTTIKTLL